MKRKNILIIILILVLFLFFNNNPFFIQAAGESNLGLQIEPLYQCADGLDNDGDGLIDYPNDPGCSSASDNDETDPSVAQCADGLDNDGDGLIDYPNDPGCSSASDNDEYNAPGGGGGGGGGGGIPTPTTVNLSGQAYPLSNVTVLKDGQIAVVTIAGPDANFNISLSNLSEGNYIFSVFSEDNYGRRSSLFSFSVYVTSGATTQISGIFLSPTIAVNRNEIKKGEDIAIFGQSIPDGIITIAVNSEEEYFVTTPADESGVYLYNFDTTPLAYGQHLTKSKARRENEVSNYGRVVTFKVGTETKGTGIGILKGDLNDDGRVNLIDFSIAAFWYKRILSETFSLKEAERLSNDGKVDLVDFSIMAYYWTG